MKPTKDVLKRFIKDTSMPFHLVEEPYFQYYLDLYEPDFGARTAYEKLLDELTQYESCEQFLDEYYLARDRLINEIKEKDAYLAYNAMDMQSYAVGNIPYPNAVKQDVYRAQFIGRRFISIDLVKANFQVLRKLNPELVNQAASYADFVKAATNSAYIASSKYTRQIIFGNMNPKRQVTMQRYYTHKLLALLLEHGICNKESVIVFTYDEIVLDRALLPEQEQHAEKITALAKELLDLEVRVDCYQLRSIINKTPYAKDTHFFVKEFDEGTFEFKRVPGHLFPQVFKAYKGIPLDPDFDLVFKFEHYLAAFQTPLFAGGFEIV